MEFLFEAILEIFGEVYLEIMTAVSPKTKLKKWQMKMIIGTEALVLLVLAIVGAIMVGETNGQSVAGKVMLIASLSVIVLQMTFGAIMKIRKSKNK